MAAILIRKFEKIEIEQDEFLEFGKFYSKYQLKNKFLLLMILAFIFSGLVFDLKNFAINKFIIDSLIKAIVIFLAFKYVLPSVFYPFVFKQQYKKNLSGKITKIALNENDIIIESHLGNGIYHLPKVEEVIDGVKCLYLKLNSTTFQIIPKRYFNDEDDAKSFMDNLNSEIRAAKINNAGENDETIKNQKANYQFHQISLNFLEYFDLFSCTKSSKNKYLINVIAPIIFSYISFFYFIENFNFNFAILFSILVFGALYCFLLYGLPFLFVLIVWIFYKKALNVPDNYSVFFDETGCWSTSERSTGRMEYSQLIFFKETANTFALSSNYLKILLLPKRYFVDEVQLNDFREFIRAHFDKAKLKK